MGAKYFNSAGNFNDWKKLQEFPRDFIFCQEKFGNIWMFIRRSSLKRESRRKVIHKILSRVLGGFGELHHLERMISRGTLWRCPEEELSMETKKKSGKLSDTEFYRLQGCLLSFFKSLIRVGYVPTAAWLGDRWSGPQRRIRWTRAGIM